MMVTGKVLAFNPFVGPCQPILEADRRLPSEIIPDQGVIAVSTIDSARRVEFVPAFQANAGYLLDNVDKLIDGDQLAAAKVDGFADVAFHNGLGAIGAVVDIHKAARLLAIAPDLDFVAPRVLSLNDFPANRGWSFLSAPGPGSVGTVDIVIPRNPGLETKILFKVPAHPFAEELFPPVTVFGKSRIGIFFLQRTDIRSCLFLSVVNAGG